MQHAPKNPRGFTLTELFVVLLILSVTAFVLFPIMTGHPTSKVRLQRGQCMSNLKQIGWAALMYSHDFDETLPPAARYKFSKPTKAKSATPVAGLFWTSTIVYSPPFAENSFGTLPYLAHYLDYHRKTPQSYQCSLAIEAQGVTFDNKFDYLTNDLAGGAKLRTVAKPGVTVLMMDGESAFPTAGHAYEEKAAHQYFAPNVNAVISGAVTRHMGGANYLFADGHIHWYPPSCIFFPPRDSVSKTHRDAQTSRIIGPDPSGDMTYNGRKYEATFHLR